MRAMNHLGGAAALALTLLFGAVVRADDESAKPDGTQPAAQATDEEIAKLVLQLDAERFADRQAATRRLEELGKAAVPALEKAALGESLEATIRSIDLLRKFLDSTDADLAEKAQKALESVAKSERQGAARRARETLDAKKQASQNQMLPGGFQIQGANVQIGAGGMRRMSVRNNNGVRDIDIVEGDRKVKIHDDPQKGIQVEITTTKDGKDKTEKIEAKNADELKQKHPEAHRYYQQVGQNAGGMFQMQVQVGGQAVPVPVIVPDQQVRHASAIVQSLGRHLQTITKGADLKKAGDPAKDDLKKALGGLKDQIADLEKRLAEKEPPPAEKPEKTP